MVLKFAYYLFKNYTNLVVIGLITVIIGAIINAGAAILLAPIFELIMQDQGTTAVEFTDTTKKCLSLLEAMGLPQTPTFALLLFLTVYLSHNLMAIITGWIDANVRASLSREMTVNTFKAVVNANWSFFLNRNQGEFISTINREIPFISQSHLLLSNCVVAICQIFFFSLIALYISWQLTLACLIIGFVLGIPFMLLSKLNYKWGKSVVVAASKSNSITQESFSLAKIIQGFARQDESVSRLIKEQTTLCKMNVKTFALTTIVHQLYYPLGILCVIAAYYISRRFNLPFAELVIIFYALWKMVPLASNFLKNYSNLLQFMPSFETIRELELEALNDLLCKDGRPFGSFEESIELNNICFKYQSSEHNILDNITMSIPKGKMIAIVGKSGGGKSTLIDLIMGYHEAETGSFMIDGNHFSDISLQSYRNKIGYVPQNNVLFNTTIKENLLWSEPNASLNDIANACKMANIFDFINTLPDKFDTEIGDRGMRLSGGQVQRIAIARAILRKPDILILDEATSALDSESENLIQEAISTIAKSTTLIVIAHRLSTIKSAHFVYVLDEGRVIEQGTYSILSENKHGAFHEMLQNQLTDKGE